MTFANAPQNRKRVMTVAETSTKATKKTNTNTKAVNEALAVTSRNIAAIEAEERGEKSAKKVAKVAKAVEKPAKKEKVVRPADPRLPSTRKDGTRRTGNDRGDEVAKLLRECNSIEEIISACDGIIDAAELRERHKKAPNFGQFRMVVGNRLRGEIARRRKADDAEAKEVKKAAKKVKASPEPEPKKVAKKTAKSA